MITNVSARFATALGFVLFSAMGSGCSTYYDAYGYPRQAVDPGLAVAGAVAVGALGYALADSHDRRRHHYSHPRGYSRRNYHYERRRRNHWH